MTTKFAVIQISGPFHGIGARPEEAIAAARQYDDAMPETIPMYPMTRMRDAGDFYVAPISQALYDTLNAGDAEPAYHQCVTGLLELGSECVLEHDETSQEAEARQRQSEDQALRIMLEQDIIEAERRLMQAKRQLRELKARSSEARQQAAAAWSAWLDEIRYAIGTHANYVKNNLRPADRERLAEPTPANVLETARRRGCAAEWVTPTHMYRAMRALGWE